MQNIDYVLFGSAHTCDAYGRNNRNACAYLWMNFEARIVLGTFGTYNILPRPHPRRGHGLSPAGLLGRLSPVGLNSDHSSRCRVGGNAAIAWTAAGERSAQAVPSTISHKTVLSFRVTSIITFRHLLLRRWGLKRS